MAGCNVSIVQVPIPNDEHKRPDLAPLIKATETIARTLKNGDIVVYRSAVYSGATEVDCALVLDRVSAPTLTKTCLPGAQ
ncbi:hypothetical protein [Marinobacter sp. F4218]|uniref:hypothetical protein n=1 Tax=Marinobacter sp. F4218 TaxID=2862868 RepID=UPI002B4A3610|nr:hypothetical protein [Marinobacter sp. F4218]